MTKILLGQTIEGPIFYDYNPTKSRGIIIEGITGSRKTSMILELVKRFVKAEPRPQIILISKDGEEAKLRKEVPLILIGNQGEVPIEPRLAKVLGEQVRKQFLDVIVDISSLKTEKSQDDFLSQFIDGILLDGEYKFWKPCVFIIDEVQIFCNSSKGSKSRDAITNLVQLCLKRGIVPCFASHTMREFYKRSRDEVPNSIIGYLRNPSERELACDLLNMDSDNADKIADFINEPKGRFFAEGSDICTPAKIFQLESTPYSDESRYEIPKLGKEGLEKAKILRESLNVQNDVSIETRLRFENAELQGKVDLLSMNQMTEEVRTRIFRNGVLEGYRQSTHDQAKMVRDFIENNSGIFGRFKRQVVEIKQVVDSEGKTRLVL